MEVDLAAEITGEFKFARLSVVPYGRRRRKQPQDHPHLLRHTHRSLLAFVRRKYIQRRLTEPVDQVIEYSVAV
jgi:hypothetical protein